jgi:hypothetical protein
MLLRFSSCYAVKHEVEGVRQKFALADKWLVSVLPAEIVHYDSQHTWVNNASDASIFSLQSLNNIDHLKNQLFKTDFLDTKQKRNEPNPIGMQSLYTAQESLYVL